MLQHLSIRNYALIDHLELELPDGFSVITGETGAGKSIILGALSMILGKRADLKSVRKADQKCVVEGTFRLNGKEHLSFFTENDLDFEEISIIRREISPSGKSRSFVNDTPVTLDVLGQLTLRLIDVHSQHQNLLLNNTAFQLQLLDSFANNEELRNDYTHTYKDHQELRSQLKTLIQISENESGDSDYLEFLFNELEAAELKRGEQEDIEEQLRVAESAGDIQQGLADSLNLLENDSGSVLSSLRQASANLNALQKFDEFYAECGRRLDSCRIELDDLRVSMEEKLSKLDTDPEEISRLDQRLSLIMTLQKKHGVQSVEDLLTRKEELDHKIGELARVEEKMAELQAEEQTVFNRLKETSKALHQSRTKVVANLQKEIETLLQGLNMGGASFQISVLETDQYSNRGNNKIDFLFSANKGQQPAPLSKVASGGELSRVMLAVKAILARSQNLPSIVFDEIDTGVSGETARKIGDILKEMGHVMQVLAISHLPQIASLGKNHFKVLKEVKEDETFSRIFLLNDTEQIDELARMLSGDNISDAARQNARELRDQLS